MNGYIKDPAHEALDDAGRRRLFGTAAQSLLTALLLMAAKRAQDPGLHSQLCGRPRLAGPAPPPTPHPIGGGLPT
jgi:hypothetical protein